MKFTRFLAAALGIAACTVAWADGPFRAHRYDSFKATPTEPNQIVFAGNSITNMHSWFEAFGSHQEIIGRGNSGGFAYELLDNLESYIDSKPSKLFVMIGTNDVSSGQSYKMTAKRIETIARRVRLESPETEVYIESILPRSNNAKPDYEQCNTLVREWVEALGDEKVHFVNLSEVCAPLNGNATWSHDGLHPRPVGYAAWTHHIEDAVGYPSVYPETITTQNSCGLSYSDAARVEQFPYFPVKEGDVLFFGDEQVHGGEWHELLRSNKIKDRGLKWGWGGIALDKARNVVESALGDQAEKPAKIFLFYGVGGKDLNNYRLIVDEAKKQAPEAGIYLVSLAPSTNDETNSANVAFNTSLSEIAAEKGATYVDVYTPLNENVGANIMHTNYISGRGYIVMANKLAEYLAEERVNPVSIAEYEAVYNRRTVRTIIGNALTSAMMLDYGVNPGQIKEQYRAAIEEGIAAAAAYVNTENLTADAATEAANALNAIVENARADMNYPKPSTETDSYWYSLVSSRGNKAVTASDDGKLVGGSASGVSSLGLNIWKFVERGDNTYDIVNYYGEYINPTASHDTQMTVTAERPDRGFSLGLSNYAPGNFVIYTSNSQLNQTGNENKIFNWYGTTSTPNRDDQGCSYAISLFEGAIIDRDSAPVKSGWYKVKRAADNLYVVNMETSARQNDKYSYSMQYVAEEETSPKGWVYINVDGETRHVQSLNGYYLGEFVANSSTPYSFVMNASPNIEGAYNVQYWLPFTIDGVNNVIGRSSGANHPHFFTRVSDAELEGYDVWTVLVAANPAGELLNNTKVTYTSDNNKGISTVYNYGKFFVTAGTVINPDDITVTAPEGVEQERETPEIVIDEATKIISVVLSGTVELPDAPATETMAAGWYTVTLAGYEGTRTDIAGWVNDALAAGSTSLHASETEYEQTLQGNKFYYHVGVSDPATLASPALTFFMVENPSLTTLNLRSQNGHHVMANGTAGRDAVNLSLTLTRNGLATLPVCLWKNNNISAPHDLVGSFSGSKCIYKLKPASLADYDVYTVNIIGETPATAIRDDVRITLGNQDASRGLQSVYNGGAFFVVKGTQVAVSDISVPAHADNSNPFISIEDGVITVDYTREQVSVVDVESAAGTKADEAFDLWGRRVATPRHGLYIVNGRKVRL